MTVIRAKRILMLLAVLMLVASAASGAGGDYLLAGGDEAMWIVKNRAGEKGPVFDLVARRRGKQWKWVAAAQRGMPDQAVATGDDLHVFFADGSSLVFSVDNPLNKSSVGNRLQLKKDGGESHRLRAACSGRGIGNGLPLLVVSGPLATTVPADGVRRVNLSVMQQSSGTWTTLARLDVAELADDDRLFVSIVDKSLVLMTTNPKGGAVTLHAWSDQKWVTLDTPPLPKTAVPVALLTVDKQIVIPLVVDGESSRRSVQLAVADRADGQFVYQPVKVDNELLTWPKDTDPLAGCLGDQLVLLWKTDDVIRVATGDKSGGFTAAEKVDVFAQPADDISGRTILEKFLWGLMLVILVVLLTLRPRGGAVQLVLPEGLRPAPMPRRFLAALIDMLPFLFLLTIAIPQADSTKNLEMLRQGMPPVIIVYWLLSALVAYTLYCIFMEKQFGATLGKMAMKIRVIGYEGNNPDLRETLTRNLTRLIPLFAPPLVPLLVLFPLLNPNRQRLGDLLARTTVIDSRFKPTPTPPPENEADINARDDDNAPPPPGSTD